MAKKRVKRYIEFNDPKWARMWYLVSNICLFQPLTHFSLASFLWDIDNQCITRSDATECTSDQVLHCLLTECTFKN